MELTLTERQRNLFNNGWKQYIKKPIILGLIAGLICGIVLSFYDLKYSNWTSPHNPVIEKFVIALIPILGFGFLGAVIGDRGWNGLYFTAWRVIGQDLHFNKTTTQEIEERLGVPNKKDEKNGAVYYYYNNIIDKKHDLKIKYIKLKFKNNLLTQYNK